MAGAQTITEFSAGITEEPWNITSGPDGNLWFTQYSGNQIGRITPGGVVTEFSTGLGTSPLDITAGPDGNLWFTKNGDDSIGRMTPAGAVTGDFPVAPGSNLSDITDGPDGNLWFTEPGLEQIGKVTTAGVVTEYPLPPGGENPIGITAGPDGNVWFTLDGAIDQIGSITPAGTVTLFPGLVAGSNPVGITAGPDGNLWFAERGLVTGQKIGRMTTGGGLTEFSSGITFGSNPWNIAAGSDGNLWFTENADDRVARITAAGVVTEFSSGITPGAAPRGITSGSDGNLWFVETGPDRIGRVTLSGSPPQPSPPVQGQTATVSPVSGTVLVKLPGATDFVPLGEADSIPVGSTLDTRSGIVELTTAADKAGATQTAQFKYGLFKITQSAEAGAYTELQLTGPLSRCSSKKKNGKGKARSAVRGPAAQVAARGRRLWGSGKGRFRSRGRRGAGTIRGTVWQVEDRCNKTTKIRSFKGKVTARDFVRKRSVTLRSGQGYTAPGPLKRKK